MTVSTEAGARSGRTADDLPALAVRDLVVRYGTGQDALRAVDGVTVDVQRGRTLGVIGESGSGKSTLAKAIAGLAPVSEGSIRIAGPDGALVEGASSVGRGGQVQMIFQDPALALNPLRRVWQSIVEPMASKRLRVSESLKPRAVELLEQVGLPAEMADRRPAQMSGGQRQRVTIARAVAARSPLVMCDEPVAALDISLQAGVLRLLDDLRRDLGLTYVFISHDMSSIARIADEVGVMYLGQMVEIGPVRSILRTPRHPYTQALIRAVPKISADPAGAGLLPLEGEIPDARKPPSGCRFRTRCPFAQQVCAELAPTAEVVSSGPGGGAEADRHQTACHFWREIRDGVAAPRAI